MKKNLNILVAIFCIVIIIGFFIIISVFKPTNWQPNFEAHNDNAFGLSIINKEIDSLLSNNKITRVNQYLTDYIYDNDSVPATILYINKNFDFYYDDFVYYKEFIKKGNDIFIIANDINYYYTPEIPDTINIKPNSKLTFTDKNLKKYESNYIYKTSFKPFILNKDSLANNQITFEVLGKINNQDAFYRYKIGEGNLYIHQLPHVFSNHYLKNNTLAYPSAVLSYIKQKNVTFINDSFPYYEEEYFNNYDNDEKGILYFILSNKYLKTAWYLLLFGGICFVLFKIKRTQRIIPIIPENKNRTVEFVQTISNLYYNQQDTNGIVKRMCKQFLDKVEAKYQLNTQNLDENFIKLLSKYSGLDDKYIKDVILKIGLYQHSDTSPTKEQINDLYLKMKKIIK